eukprot:9503974-Pyramimonas_sp.AAC.1
MRGAPAPPAVRSRAERAQTDGSRCDDCGTRRLDSAGLCHGISGNGYALLCMWRATQHARWLHRARQFGKFICSEQGRQDWGTPDNPCSLFEVRPATAVSSL